MRETLLTRDDFDRINTFGLDRACIVLQSLTLRHVIGDKFSNLHLQEHQGKKELENFKKDVASRQALEDEVKQLKE